MVATNLPEWLAARQAVLARNRAGLRRQASTASFTLGARRAGVTCNFRSARVGELKADVLVLGAGMVGVGVALHLQKRGRDVILVDRHELAGEETSYGNSGIIECTSVFPYMFPRQLGEILRYATNRAPQVHYSLRDLPSF